jgi:hypothetical protein
VHSSKLVLPWSAQSQSHKLTPDGQAEHDPGPSQESHVGRAATAATQVTKKMTDVEALMVGGGGLGLGCVELWFSFPLVPTCRVSKIQKCHKKEDE